MVVSAHDLAESMLYLLQSVLSLLAQQPHPLLLLLNLIKDIQLQVSPLCVAVLRGHQAFTDRTAPATRC